MVVVVDDADRENEGDIIMAAEKATTETLAFIVRHCSGVICVAMEHDELERLKLPPMVVDNEVRRAATRNPLLYRTYLSGPACPPEEVVS
jgi:3,4-dihydroxy 2-butanone 4-phosphate synthase/GTP cyclohydrolase II